MLQNQNSVYQRGGRCESALILVKDNERTDVRGYFITLPLRTASACCRSNAFSRGRRWWQSHCRSAKSENPGRGFFRRLILHRPATVCQEYGCQPRAEPENG